MSKWKAVWIHWVDSVSGPRWEDHASSVNHDALNIETVGWLVLEDDKTVTVSTSIQRDQVCAPLTIPKCSVVSMKTIKLPKAAGTVVETA
jgi:hypothetical protein